MADKIQDYIEGLVKGGNTYLERFLAKNSLLKDILEDARAKGVSKEIIQLAENRGMLEGQLGLTYEGAQRIASRISEIITKAGERDNKDYHAIFNSFDPVVDHDLIANGLFSLIPEIREYVKNNADTLYKVILMANTSSKIGYSLPTKPKNRYYDGSDVFPPFLDDLTKLLPLPKTSEEVETQKRLQLLIDAKAEREIFPLFMKNPFRAREVLEKKIARETNDNLRTAYARLYQTYANYLDLKLKEVNEKFQDPTTGKTGVLPSLHQRGGIYHLLKEKRLGLFDKCGTGKTAIAILTAPLIKKALGKERLKSLIICPNSAKKAWKKGLIGNEKERYLASSQNIMVINGEEKSPALMEKIEAADWVILNYEQLITRTASLDRYFLNELLDKAYDYVILDEAHHIKGQAESTTKGRPTLSKAAQMLARNTKYLALLTASPIADRLIDYGVPSHLLQPESFPTPQSLPETIGNNPRALYTFFREKTLRRTLEDIGQRVNWEEKEVLVELGPLQRKLYNHIIEFRPSHWMIQARKALLDPRLVDPEVLKRAGVLGEISLEDSAKYQQLAKMLIDPEGPVARGEKFIIFSTLFKEGVTQPEHAYLASRYADLGVPHLYDELGLNRSLEMVLSEVIQKRLGKEQKIGVIDGNLTNIEDRERIVERLNEDLCGITCTTDTGGESLDFTPASQVFFLDEDYTPTTGEQALSRIVRKGQKRKVTINHLRAHGTLDEILRDYVEKKRIINTTATDGHPLTPEEWDLLEDTKGKKLGELIKRGLGGVSIDTYDAGIESLDDFEVKKRIKRKGVGGFNAYSETTTEAQEVMRWIGKDPFNCWKDPSFVELYMRALPNLSVPVIHRAKICDLVRRAKEGEIVFPSNILSDGSGPSILYDAYQTLKPIINKAGYEIPQIMDRDTSQLMLDKGNNPNKVLASMTGVDSPFTKHTFDMVDNESISLLPNPEEVKNTLLETHRVLRPKGLVELVVKNRQFSKEFYSGMETLGFELLTGKKEGFFLSDKMFRRLKKLHGEHFAESYRNKLSSTYLLLARKVDGPAKVEADGFWFEKSKEEEAEDHKEVFIPRAPKQQPEVFTPEKVVKVDRFGNVISINKVKKNE